MNKVKKEIGRDILIGIIVVFIIVGFLLIISNCGENFDLSNDENFVGKLTVCMIICVSIIILGLRTQKEINNPILNFGENGKKLPNISEINYYRDIPCKGDLYRAYWLVNKYGLLNAISEKSALFGAIMLDWLNQGYITIQLKKNNKYVMDLTNIQNGRNELENELLLILKRASGKNELLEPNEFKKWLEEHQYELRKWFNDVIEYETKKLQEEEMIYVSTTYKKIFIIGKKKINTKTVKEYMKEEAIQLLGLKKYLNDYSIIKEREANEVIIWGNYLSFAQLLGVADRIKEQFSKINPNFLDLFNFNSICFTTFDKIDKMLGEE